MSENKVTEKFNQNVAESLNQMSQESAKDMMDRAMRFGIELDDLIHKHQRTLSDVIIDGMLLHSIHIRANHNYRLAEQLLKEQRESK